MSTWYEKFFGAVDRFDIEEFLDCVTDDISMEYGNNPTVTGKENIKEMVEYAWTLMEKLTHHYVNVYEISDTKAIFECNLSYVMKDGRTFDIPACTVLEHRGDKVCRFKNYLDPSPVYDGLVQAGSDEWQKEQSQKS